MAQISTHDLFLSCATSERNAFWAERGHLHPDEIQRLWERRMAEILSALKPVDPPPVIEMARAVSDQPTPTFTPGCQMQRNHFTTGSKRLSPSYASNMSSSRAPNQSVASGMHWPTNEEPWNGLPQPNKRRRTDGGGRQQSAQAYSPGEYVKKIKEETDTAIDCSTRAKMLQRAKRPGGLIAAANLAPLSPASPLSLSPTKSIASPLTDASTLPTEMSRDSTGSSLAMHFNMARISSDSPSEMSLDPTNAFTNFQSPPLSNSFKEPELATSFTEGAELDFATLSAGSAFCPDSYLEPFFSQQDLSPTLEAQMNAGGIKIEDRKPSAASRQRRSHDQLARSKKQPLLPREDEKSPMELKPKETLELTEPAQSPSDKGKMAIPKLAIIPESVDKPKCTKCNKKPDGFRGPHELERHMLRDHPKKTSTFFICVDKSPNQTMLAGCRKCATGKKYNAYYNTAAHIRRHFARAEGGRAGAGSSGGDDPPMNWLKSNGWIKKVTVDVQTDVDANDQMPTTTTEDPRTPLDAPPSTLDIADDMQPIVGTTSADPHDFFQDFGLDDSTLFNPLDPFWGNFPSENSPNL